MSAVYGSVTKDILLVGWSSSTSKFQLTSEKGEKIIVAVGLIGVTPMADATIFHRRSLEMEWHLTFLRGSKVRRPTKLTARRNPIIHPMPGSL
jgi:hypothetical protein